MNRPPGFRRGYGAACCRASRWVFADNSFGACSKCKQPRFQDRRMECPKRQRRRGVDQGGSLMANRLALISRVA